MTNKYLYILDVLVIGLKWSRWYVLNRASPLGISFSSPYFLSLFFSDNIHIQHSIKFSTFSF